VKRIPCRTTCSPSFLLRRKAPSLRKGNLASMLDRRISKGAVDETPGLLKTNFQWALTLQK
jgi:hypothetical protein